MTNPSLAGYRLVRKLGEGRHAETFLAHPLTDLSEPSSASDIVAMKIYKASALPPDVLDSMIDKEIGALGRAAGRHVVALLDLSTSPGGFPVLILQRLASHSIGRLLEERDTLQLGEVITLLAPVAGALNRMHRAGVAHGGIRPGAVLFDSVGAPVLARFGSSSLIPIGLPPAGMQDEPAVLEDIRAFGHLTAALLARVRGEGAVQLAAWVTGAPAVDDFFEIIAVRLFDLGDPLPVDLLAETGREDSPVPQRVFRGAPVAEPPESHARTLVASLGLPEFIENVVRARARSVAETARLAVIGLRAVRIRMWVIAGSVAVAMIVAMIGLSTGGTTNASPPVPASISGGSESAGPIPPVPEDPLVAVPELLDARQRCIAAMSILCLDDVDQAGSSALAFDYEAVEQLRDGGEAAPWSVEIAGAVITERLGDAALVSFDSPTADSQPADAQPADARAPDRLSGVLLMKGPDGWRIRDYYFDSPHVQQR